MRNPFTSVANISFLRNNSRVSQHTKDTYTPRSLSNHKYFDYKFSYMHDTYLMDYQTRKQQENTFCKVMGLEAMRYRPDPPFIDNEYYAMESSCKPIEAEFKPEDTYPTDTNTNAHSAMKNTRDMFGSDYFTSRTEPNQGEEATYKKTALKRKDTNGSSRLRFNKVKEVYCSQLSEEPSHLQDSFEQEGMSQIGEAPPLTIEFKKRTFYLYDNQQQ